MKRSISQGDSTNSLGNVSTTKTPQYHRKMMLQSILLLPHMWIGPYTDLVFLRNSVSVLFRLMWNGIWKTIRINIKNVATIGKEFVRYKYIPKDTESPPNSDMKICGQIHETQSHELFLSDKFTSLSLNTTKFIDETKVFLIELIHNEIDKVLSILDDPLKIKNLFFDITDTKIKEIEIHFGGICVQRNDPTTETTNRQSLYQEDNPLDIEHSNENTIEEIQIRQNVLDFDFGKDSVLYPLMKFDFDCPPENPSTFKMFTSMLFSVACFFNLRITSYCNKLRNVRFRGIDFGRLAKISDYCRSGEQKHITSDEKIDQVFFSGSKGIHVWLDNQPTLNPIMDDIKNLYKNNTILESVKFTIEQFQRVLVLQEDGQQSQDTNFDIEIGFIKFLVNEMHMFEFYKKLSEKLVIKIERVTYSPETLVSFSKFIINQTSPFEHLIYNFIYEICEKANYNKTTKILPKISEKKTKWEELGPHDTADESYTFSNFVFEYVNIPMGDEFTNNKILQTKFPNLSYKEIITRLMSYFMFFNPLTSLDPKVNLPKSIIRAPFSINSKTMVRSFNLDLETVFGKVKDNFDISLSYGSFESIVEQNKN